MISPTEIVALAMAFAVSAAIAWVWRRAWPDRATFFYAPVAVASACIVASMAVFYRDALPPSRHFHWPPYLALATAIVSPLALLPRVPLAMRWALHAATALACAYFLTPTWPSLWPARGLCIPLLAGYLLAIAITIQALAMRIPPWTMLAAMTMTVGTLATLVLAIVSLTYGISAMIAAAAFAGYGAWASRTAQLEPPVGLAWTYAVLAGAWAFIGCMEPRPAEWALLIAPLAPVALWASTMSPLAKFSGKTAILVRMGLLTTVLCGAAIAVAL